MGDSLGGVVEHEVHELVEGLQLANEVSPVSEHDEESLVELLDERGGPGQIGGQVVQREGRGPRILVRHAVLMNFILSALIQHSDIIAMRATNGSPQNKQ